nr:hypothetical protein [Tanacetum cinerariifolium]
MYTDLILLQVKPKSRKNVIGTYQVELTQVLILETLPQPDPIGMRLSGLGCIQVSAIDHEEIRDEDTSPSETK